MNEDESFFLSGFHLIDNICHKMNSVQASLTFSRCVWRRYRMWSLWYKWAVRRCGRLWCCSWYPPSSSTWFSRPPPSHRATNSSWPCALRRYACWRRWWHWRPTIAHVSRTLTFLQFKNNNSNGNKDNDNDNNNDNNNNSNNNIMVIAILMMMVNNDDDLF